MKRRHASLWERIGRGALVLATLLFVLAPCLDAAASSRLPQAGAPVASSLLPTWLDVVDDPLDHRGDCPPCSNCHQVNLSPVVLPTLTALPILVAHAQIWAYAGPASFAQCPPSRLERPPQA